MMKGNTTKHKEAHSANMKKGMGDYYGTGVKAKIGRVRESFILNPVSKSKMKKPPRSLA